MKKVQSYLFAAIILFVSVFTAACSRYPDNGGLFTGKSPEKRLSTTWRVKEASQNGMDITAQFTGDFIEFNENGSMALLDAARSISLPPFTKDTVVPVPGIGVWSFLSDKTKLDLLYTFTFNDPYNPKIVYKEEVNQIWEITKLDKEALWVKNDSTILRFEFFNQ